MTEQGGYPDWRRLADYDSELYVDLPPGARSDAPLFGPFYVASYAYLSFAGQFVGPETMIMTIQWFADEAMTKVTATRITTLDCPLGTEEHIFRWPNMGRFVLVGLQSTANPWNPTYFRVFGSNRDDVIESMPRYPLSEWTSPIVVPGNSTFLTMLERMTGPATLMLETGAAPGLAVLQAHIPGLGYFNSDLLNGPAAGSFYSKAMILPATSWRIRVQNTGGVNSSYQVQMTPSPTGA